MRRALVCLLALAGCTGEPATALEVNVSSAEPLSTLAMLVVRSPGAAPDRYTLPAEGGPPTLPGIVRVRLDDADALIEVTLEGTADGDRSARASGSVQCRAHRTCSLALNLALQGQVIGAACADGLECVSGFCVGNVCCDAACDGACATCLAKDGASADGRCGLRPSGTACGGSVMGDCDLPDTCNGTSPTCPDLVAAAGTVCRPATLACDVAESCNGTNAQCPANASLCLANEYCGFAGCTPKIANGEPCFVIPGSLDQDQCQSGLCNGNCCATSCPGGCQRCTATTEGGTPGACVLRAAATVCRGSTNACDPPETCDGAGIACPADTKKPTTKSTFTVEATGRGTIRQTLLDTNLVQPRCLASGAPFRAYMSFDTSSIPATASVASAEFVACRNTGSTAATALLDVSFPIPLTSAAYNVSATALQFMGASDASAQIETTVLQPTMVHPGVRSQLSMRLTNESCNGLAQRTYSIAADMACGATTDGPKLNVEWCN